MRMRLNASLEYGFTLLEVVVAIVIIAALAAAFAPFIASSVQRIQWAGQRTQELYSIRSIMEREIGSVKSGNDTVEVKGFSEKDSNRTYIGKAEGKIIRIKDEVADFVTFVMPRNDDL